MKKLLLLSLLVLSCGHRGTTHQPADVTQYDATVARLPNYMNPSGWIVGLNSSGAATDQGDSLIFSGITMASLSCAAGEPIADALEAMLLSQNGAAYRHPSLVGQISLDGLLGMYSGIAERVARCGESARWATALAKHRSWTLTAAGLTALPPEFNVSRDTLLHTLGLADAPSLADKAALDVEVAGWAKADLLAKKACYRLNLGLLALQVADATPAGSALFCDATKTAGIPLIDQYCGRSGLEAWIDGFKPDVYYYAFQRCPAWESPDLNGGTALGTDMLAGWTEFYGPPAD